MNTTLCPSCSGTGGHREVVRSRGGVRKVKCISCRGEGKVEADRVCCQCHQWLAGCTCHDRNLEIVVVRRVKA